MTTVNQKVWSRLQGLRETADELKIDFVGEHIVDFGVESTGGLIAGLELARICMGDMAQIQLLPGTVGMPWVQVVTDQPARACMGSQYGGWPVQAEKFFAIGSGPARLLRGKEKVLKDYAWEEASGGHGVLVLESGKLPPANLIEQMKEECGVPGSQFSVCVAPTKSLAGSLQIVARSVEAVMHKLYELGADLNSVVSAMGDAPLPPIAKDDLTAIGRTNDAILYGGSATVWVDMNDDEINQLGPRVPSNSSAEYGRPFGEIFAASGGDFYQLDPMLFSAGSVTFVSCQTGNTFRFGELRMDIVQAASNG